MPDNDQKNRKDDSTGEGMDIDTDECPPHGPKCSICKKYANHKKRLESDDDDTTHLKQKLLKHTADTLQTEAGLHKKIAELRAEIHRQGEELWKMKEENMKKELEAERGKQPTENQPPRPPPTREPTPRPPPHREPTLRGRSPQRQSRPTSRAQTPQRRSMSPPRRRQSPLRRDQETIAQPSNMTGSTSTGPPNSTESQAIWASGNDKPTTFSAKIQLTTQHDSAKPTIAMAAWRNAPPPAPTGPPTSSAPVVLPEVNATRNASTPRPDPNIERDESDYGSDSSEDRKKKKRPILPKPPKVPKVSASVTRDQRAFIGSRAPLWDDLPRISMAPQRLKMDFNEPEARRMLRDVQTSGRFDLIDTIRRIVTEVQSRRRNGIIVHGGPALLEREWQKPEWYNDTKRIRLVCESAERQRDAPFAELRLDLPSRGQPSHQSDRDEHARWAAMYGTPATYPGVSISSTLQLDLLGIQAVMYFRQLVPTNRSYTGPRGRNEHGTPPGTRARTRWIALFIELLSQPYLYEQLVHYYGSQIHPNASFYSFNGSINTDMRELVSGLARRGFTARHSYWMYEWAMNYLRDSDIIHDDTSNHSDFPRGLLLSRAADRLREVGAPPVSNLPFNRLWSPPATWDVSLYFQERNRRLTLAGQQRRAGRHNLPTGNSSVNSLPAPTPATLQTSGETVRAHTSPADARERDETAAPTSGAAASSSGTALSSGTTPAPTTSLPVDEDTHMEDVSQVPPSSTVSPAPIIQAPY
ncbi:hypothetical protein V5O48_017026, partial [Marasmius crinis-equi]